MNEPPVIEADNLVVEYGRGAKAVRALQGISFRVEPGECVGFIGANGAGKTSTIKTLMGFIFPSSGSVRMFGRPAGRAQSRRRIGYLPEVAQYYPFMKARELLELYGGLSGLSRTQLRRRIPPLLEKVGLAGKGEVLLKNFSKGMQQRLGIAQALIAEPDALIFDELSSGLDPLGRHDLRQVLLELKRAGRTIFFSSHELTEVEALCDRVLIIHKGRIVTEAAVDELLKPLNQFEILVRRDERAALPAELDGCEVCDEGEMRRFIISDLETYTRALDALRRTGADVVKTESRTRSLEQYFIELVRRSAGHTQAESSQDPTGGSNREGGGGASC
ncbi:MAG: ABC transporter ATP-binding protein [Candidatus Sumerlaeia bacterium]